MRIIGALPEQNAAHRFHSFLERQGIESRCEALFDAKTESFSYEIWAVNEDRLQEAAELFKHFEAHPHDRAYDIPVQEILEGEKPVARAIPTPITSFFLFLCVFVFGMGLIQEQPLVQEGLTEEAILFTPIEATLLIDLPAPIEEFEQWLKSEQDHGNIEKEIPGKIKALEASTWWQGVYQWAVLKAKTGDGSKALGPIFFKVRQGEVWRLFTPALLHANLLHILFNMIWLWVLCRPIEQRIGSARLFAMTLLLGILTNVFQYLMSGPLFLGYSGIIAGLAGFIWMREKIAPWEGYPIQKMTLVFLAVFLLGMVGLQMLSFFMQAFTEVPLALGIANTGHISGVLLGLLLGYSSFWGRQKVRL